jgi:hypothetical protein
MSKMTIEERLAHKTPAAAFLHVLQDEFNFTSSANSCQRASESSIRKSPQRSACSHVTQSSRRNLNL